MLFRLAEARLVLPSCCSPLSVWMLGLRVVAVRTLAGGCTPYRPGEPTISNDLATFDNFH